MNKNKILKIGAISLASVVLGSALVYYNFIDKVEEVVTLTDVGDVSPDFTIDTYEVQDGKFVVSNEKFTLSEYKGQVVVLNFWATWCQPCKEEIPHFNELQENYSEDVKVVIINAETNNSQKLIDDYVNNEGDKSYEMYYYAWTDYSCTFACSADVKSMYAVSDAVPVTIIIDQDGVVRYTTGAKMSYEEIESEVLKYI